MKDSRICFIGDSLVNGTGDQDALGWAGRLCAYSANYDVEITYYNLGVRGQTSRDILLRLETEITPRLKKAEDGRVVVSFGVNDTILENEQVRVPKKESINNFVQIIEKLKSRYSLLIIGPLPTIDDEQNTRIRSLNIDFHAYALSQDVHYVDVFTALLNDESYKKEIKENDGAHPRRKGYERITEVILSSGKWWFSVN